MMNEYITTLKLLDKYTSTHNDLLVRSVSVTDEVLREQCQAEYLECCERIAETESLLKQAEKLYLAELTEMWFSEFLAFYATHHKPSTLADSFAKHNFDITAHTTKLRMRPIVDLKQKREIYTLLNSIDRQLRIVDYQGVEIETWGKSTDLNPLVIRLGCIVLERDYQEYLNYHIVD